MATFWKAFYTLRKKYTTKQNVPVNFWQTNYLVFPEINNFCNNYLYLEKLFLYSVIDITCTLKVPYFFSFSFSFVAGDIVYRSLFYRMPELRMPSLPMKTLSNTTVEECAKSCAQETSFDCQSFDVDNVLQTCRLHNHSHEERKLPLVVSQSTDHYRSKKAPFTSLFSLVGLNLNNYKKKSLNNTSSV